ncbi:hypothetical protein CFC21_042028 [Triticum aestivum]|uniref:DUF4005 domain-containing protein n=2 Tax=Triticum aestivum TaxID=4565 RepID=A0A9R1FM50_WHEAT|nr:protein IQ-domain 26-like [Triticum aestivum]XP_044349861.1 protein IQ-domain 26-like [Triticum aestivum]XP_044349862.1 protein IQ-domain 26-like [Triticum aestivum]KAF7030497.1 hypothetical protein CFC21_042028 [Triticum aestivum]CDM84039.1 unnamed protein product [Triticum aestivum]
MGRAMRWLKRLLTGRKEAHGGGKEIHAATDWHDAAAVKESTKRWSFVKQRKSGVDAGKRPSEPLAAALEVKPCRCAGGEQVGAREEKAAVVIQKAFRGYLARKALRALRSLVKLQALVRGYLVRKQAATTLHRLQALMRLQADSRAFKSASYRKSMEQERIVAQDARMRTPPTKPGHRRRLSDSTDSNYERSPRIVEMDTCHLRSRSSRMVSSGRYATDRSSGRLAPDLAPLFSPRSVKQPPRLSIRREPVRHAKTAQNTPRFSGADPPYTYDSPAKSVDGLAARPLWHRDLLSSPRYMAGTASSAARLRCQSAPRQPAEAPRASLTQRDVPAGPRKSTCTRTQHGGLCFHSSDAAHTRRSDLSNDAARDYYLDRMW